jgi:hypothetical protein
MNTWDKNVRVNKKNIPKKRVLNYYRKLWRESRLFRDTLRKKGAFVRATYGNKTIIKRKGVKVNNIEDLEKLIKEHAVEFHVPTSKIKYRSYLDIDLPKRMEPKRKKLSRSIVNNLKECGINISLVTDSPSGAHVFSNTPKNDLINALKKISKENKNIHIGRSSKTKIVLDPYEPNVAIPGSLSCKGKPYMRWQKT